MRSTCTSGRSPITIGFAWPGRPTRWPRTGRAPAVLALSDRNAPADAVRENRALIFPDRTAFGNAYPGWLPTFDVQAADALAVVPARFDRSPVGVLEVFFAADHAFSDEQRTLLKLTADQIGNAIMPRPFARGRTDRGHEATGEPAGSIACSSTASATRPGISRRRRRCTSAATGTTCSACPTAAS